MPCMKKLAKTIIVGVENDNQEFVWQKISSVGDNESSKTKLKKNNKKNTNVSFNEKIDKKIYDQTEVNFDALRVDLYEQTLD